VHRGLAATGVGIVKTGHVVMHQRRTVQQLDRHGGGFRQHGVVVAAGARHRQTQLGPDARAARKHGMAHRRQQARRRVRPLQMREMVRQGLFNSCEHAGLPYQTGQGVSLLRHR
jgi:hypothetical protein